MEGKIEAINNVNNQPSHSRNIVRVGILKLFQVTLVIWGKSHESGDS